MVLCLNVRSTHFMLVDVVLFALLGIWVVEVEVCMYTCTMYCTPYWV